MISSYCQVLDNRRHKKSGKWQARIKYENITRHLGLFDLEIDAAKAYNDAAISYFGSFARLNPIPENWIITTRNDSQSVHLIKAGKINKNCSSKYKGVGRTKNGRWAARIKINGRLKYLGYHDTEDQAAAAYNIAAKAAWGDIAYLNPIEIEGQKP